MKTNFSLVTYADLPNLDPDDVLLLNALQELGYSVSPLVWDDNSINWSNYSVCIIRSTWDFHKKTDLFVQWIDKVSAQANILNKSKLLKWNLNKNYLQDLQAKGIEIIPSEFIENSSSKPLLSDILNKSNWQEAVIKPSIGLATYGILKIDSSKESIALGQKHMENLLKEGSVIVQKFINSVSAYGERALVFLGGEYSHAVRKSAFQILAVAGQAGESEVTATEAEIDFAKNVISKLNEMPVYARVDIIPDEFGNLMLMELELIEPSLFFQYNKGSAKKFAEYLVKNYTKAK